MNNGPRSINLGFMRRVGNSGPSSFRIHMSDFEKLVGYCLSDQLLSVLRMLHRVLNNLVPRTYNGSGLISSSCETCYPSVTRAISCSFKRHSWQVPRAFLCATFEDLPGKFRRFDIRINPRTWPWSLQDLIKSPLLDKQIRKTWLGWSPALDWTSPHVFTGLVRRTWLCRFSRLGWAGSSTWLR